jgi:bZIP-type transcription factor MBZ1
MGDPSEFLNMYLDDDFSKPIMPPPSSGAPYDFLGAFSSITGDSSSSATSSASAATSPSHPSPHEAFSSTAGESPQMGIDPSLVGIGSPVDEFDIDEEEEAVDTVSDIIAPIKVGGKGKARKGTVASGGIKKLAPSPPSSTSSGKENDVGSGGATVEDRESDDWRPSPEEYKKMSSKEKRQLRNKISARNFRVRRKGELLF